MADFCGGVPANKSSTNSDKVKAPIDRGIDAGERHAANLLDIIAAQEGKDVGEGYAGGLLAGAIKWLAKNHGDVDAYDFCQRVADQLAERIIGEPKIR